MKKEHKNKKKDNKKKWPTFMYMGKEANIITKLFRNTSIGVSSQTKLLQPKTNTKQIHPKQHLPIKMP